MKPQIKQQIKQIILEEGYKQFTEKNDPFAIFETAEALRCIEHSTILTNIENQVKFIDHNFTPNIKFNPLPI